MNDLLDVLLDKAEEFRLVESGPNSSAWFATVSDADNARAGCTVRAGSAQRFFNGQLSDFRVTDAILTANEMLFLATLGTEGTADNATWAVDPPMQEGAGLVAHSRTSDNQGTIFGATWATTTTAVKDASIEYGGSVVTGAFIAAKDDGNLPTAGNPAADNVPGKLSNPHSTINLDPYSSATLIGTAAAGATYQVGDNRTVLTPVDSAFSREGADGSDRLVTSGDTLVDPELQEMIDYVA